MEAKVEVKKEQDDTTMEQTTENYSVNVQNEIKQEAESLENSSKSENLLVSQLGNDEGKKQQPQMSKRALKRLKKQEEWQQIKKEKRAKEREKRKNRRVIDDPNFVPRSKMRKILKTKTMATSNCKMGIVVDLSFDDYMDEKSLAKCIKQVCRCYGINRRAANPLQYHITSNTGRSLTEMAKNIGYENWDVHFHDKHFLEVFDKSKIVYLTSESENVIDKVEDDKVYVIGGLVDHNKEKGLCHRLAVEKGIVHGRLPIGEFIDMKTRKVLTIDHGILRKINQKFLGNISLFLVFNILVNVANGHTWKEAFLAVIPERKGAKAKDETDKESDDENQSIISQS